MNKAGYLFELLGSRPHVAVDDVHHCFMMALTRGPGDGTSFDRLDTEIVKPSVLA